MPSLGKGLSLGRGCPVVTVGHSAADPRECPWCLHWGSKVSVTPASPAQPSVPLVPPLGLVRAQGTGAAWSSCRCTEQTLNWAGDTPTGQEKYKYCQTVAPPQSCSSGQQLPLQIHTRNSDTLKNVGSKCG